MCTANFFHYGFNQSWYEYDVQNTMEANCWQNKEYLDSQLNSLQQNTVNKEQQLKTLQMSAQKQISMEVKDVAMPIVTNLAKQKIL